jgi:L-alanine-DL-glutamate epimerase-like enolase superfamily enzyme
MLMSIKKLELFHVALPLKTKVRHASHERMSSDSIVVKLVLDDDCVGYGEGVPRSYVTGETIASTFASLASFDASRHFGRPGTFSDVVRQLEVLELPESDADPRGMAGNSARCALELAALDAYGRKFHQSAGDAITIANVPGLERRGRPGEVYYSGAITAASQKREVISAIKMRLYRMRQIKIKVGLDDQDDPARLGLLRKIFGKHTDLRLDANEAWRPENLVDRVRPLLPFSPSVLEQPIPHADVEALRELRPKLGVPVMLDESLCSYPDALHSLEHGTADLFNVRLSKCGGIIPCLRIIALARRSDVGIQLGCHPGESGLLSAAGRHLAANVRGLRYVEGSYDRHILESNLTVEDLTFGFGGRARHIGGDGLGVTVNPEALERMTVARKEVRYD